MTEPASRSLRERARASIQKRGWWATARLAPAAVVARIRGNPELEFDQRYSVDTAGIIVPTHLKDDPRHFQSNWYGATSAKLFARMMRHIPEDLRDFAFVDYGCGKGKPLLLALRYPFRKIVGIDIWPELLAIAARNLQTYTGPRACADVEVLEVNALLYSPPDDMPGVYYFFDPFQEDVMRGVLARLRESLLNRPRKAYVIYCEPGRPDILRSAGFLATVAETPHYSIYRALSQ